MSHTTTQMYQITVLSCKTVLIILSLCIIVLHNNSIRIDKEKLDFLKRTRNALY